MPLRSVFDSLLVALTVTCAAGTRKKAGEPSIDLFGLSSPNDAAVGSATVNPLSSQDQVAHEFSRSISDSSTSGLNVDSVDAYQPSQGIFGSIADSTALGASSRTGDSMAPAANTSPTEQSISPVNMNLFANPQSSSNSFVPNSAMDTSRSSSGSALKAQYPWYRSSDEIHDEIQNLASSCSGATLSLSQESKMNDGADAGQQVSLDVVRVSKDGGGSKKKAMFVFGEHARELISPESGLQMLKTLCGKGEGPEQELATKVLDHTDFLVLPNANPLSRRSVENGEFCRRTNEDHVDINRNFGNDHREDEQKLKGDEMDPGPRGFSERESQIIRDLTSDENPDIFLSVHSGAYLLGTPYGYTRDEQPHGEQPMLDVLRPISEKFCNGDCPFGGLASLMSYKSKGSDIDWVKEQLDTPYVFTWEIYVGPNIRKYYAEEAHQRSEGRPMSDEAREFFGDDISTGGRQAATLLQKSANRQSLRAKTKRPESEQDSSACFDQFNPESEIEAQEVTHTWTRAFLTLCDEVATSQSPSNASPSKTDKAASNAMSDPMTRLEHDLWAARK